MDVHEVLLPGVGLRYELTTRAGDHLGIVALRSGGFVVAVQDPEDLDEPIAQYELNTDEAEAVAQILGAPRLTERFADLTREVPGLGAGQVVIADDSPYAGRTLGETRARTRTGASVVALVRDEDVIVSPTPDQRLEPGDTLVIIGTSKGIHGVGRIVAAT